MRTIEKKPLFKFVPLSGSDCRRICQSRGSVGREVFDLLRWKTSPAYFLRYAGLPKPRKCNIMVPYHRRNPAHYPCLLFRNNLEKIRCKNRKTLDLLYFGSISIRFIVNNIVRGAKDAGADCIITACAMCHLNLEIRCDLKRPVPILHFSELLCLALGEDEHQSWFSRHLVDPEPLLKSKGIV